MISLIICLHVGQVPMLVPNKGSKDITKSTFVYPHMTQNSVIHQLHKPELVTKYFKLITSLSKYVSLLSISNQKYITVTL